MKSPNMLEMRVAPSVAEGQFLRRARNMGHVTPGRIPGDVKLMVKHVPHDTYTLQGYDLYTVLTISVEEALYGFTKSWNLLGRANSAILVDRKGKVTEPEEVIRIRRKGVDFTLPNGRGILIIFLLGGEEIHSMFRNFIFAVRTFRM